MYKVFEEHYLEAHRFQWLPVSFHLDEKWGDGMKLNSIGECRNYLSYYSENRIQELREQIEYLKRLPELPLNPDLKIV